MTNRLSLYNGALTVVGERHLASLTENTATRHRLDQVWNNELIKRVLEHGQWNFASRAVKLTASTTNIPSFGYQYAFAKADDFCKTMRIGHDEYFNQPITRYTDEAKWIYCDPQEIYFQYVSKDVEFGSDLSIWPESFTEYVEHYIAMKAAPRLVGLAISSDEIETKAEAALVKAKSNDAMESPGRIRSQRWVGTVTTRVSVWHQ